MQFFPQNFHALDEKCFHAIPSWLSNSLHVNAGGREKRKKRKFSHPKWSEKIGEIRVSKSDIWRETMTRRRRRRRKKEILMTRLLRRTNFFVVVVVPWSMAQTGVGTFSYFCN